MSKENISTQPPDHIELSRLVQLNPFAAKLVKKVTLFDDELGKPLSVTVEASRDILIRASHVVIDHLKDPKNVAVDVTIAAASATLGLIIYESQQAKKQATPLTAEQQEQLGVMYEKYGNYLRNFVGRLVTDDPLVGNSDNVDQIMTDIFFKAIKGIKNFKAKEGLDDPLLSWLFRIAVTTVLNSKRSKIRRDKIEILVSDRREKNFTTESERSDPEEYLDLISQPIISNTPEETLIRHESLGQITQVINKLPVDEKTAIILKAVYGCSHEEIAYVLRRTPGAVKSLLHRTRVKIRHQLDEEIVSSILTVRQKRKK